MVMFKVPIVRSYFQTFKLYVVVMMNWPEILYCSIDNANKKKVVVLNKTGTAFYIARAFFHS